MYDDDSDELDLERERDFRCWSCGLEFDRDEGFSIDDTGVEQVCSNCWEKVPVDKRIYLSFLIRMGENGGMGLRELFENAVNEWGVFRKFGSRPDGKN